VVKSSNLDNTDRKILRKMNEMRTNSLTKIGKELNLSKSAIQKRLKKMTDEGIVKGFVPLIDYKKVDDQLTAISLVRGKYGPDYAERIGKELSSIKGVCAVYFVIGDYDFIVMSKAKTIEELNSIISKFSCIESIERSSTFLSTTTIFEDISLFYSFD